MKNETEKIYYFYTLRCSEEPDRVRYVGTTSRNLKDRFYEHRYKAKSGDRSQPVHKWMHSKYLKGLDIICEYLDECPESEWKAKETYWIAYYRKLDPSLLNLQDGGAGVVTDAMRNIDGKTRSIEAHKKAVIAYDLDGNEKFRFSSIVEATRYFGLKSKSTIGMAVNGKSKTAAGYIWKYDTSPKEVVVKKKNSEYNARIIVYQFSQEGDLINTFQSIHRVIAYINKRNGSGSDFKKRVLDKHKIWHGYLWSTDPNYKVDLSKIYKYYEVNDKGEVISNFYSKKEIADYFGADPTTVDRWLTKSRPTKNNTFVKIY